MLDAEEEYMLAKTGSLQEMLNLQKLVRHLRLVAKIAMGYRGYGLPLNEIISEGNVGLMQAVKSLSLTALDWLLMLSWGLYKSIY